MSQVAHKLASLSAPSPEIISGFTADQLVGAFTRFSQASKQLEAHYEILRQETEALKARLRQKDEQIAQQTRLATLGQTAAALAHEIRNPLCAMRLFLSLLREESQENPQAMQLVVHMDRTMKALDHVVENVLHFAKDNRASFAVVNLHAILQELGEMLAQQAGSNLVVKYSLEASPYVRGNEHALRQAFANLLTNAAEATRYAGVVQVDTRDREAGGTEIVITDNGPGFEPQIMEHLFEPFVTGKREGTGLGLAVVKKILDQHAAQISISNCNPPEVGSCVTVILTQSGSAFAAAGTIKAQISRHEEDE